MKLQNGTVVLIADGSRMLLLRNDGDAVFPNLKVIEHRAFQNPPNRELLSDSSGLSFSSGGFNRSTYDDTDPHQRNEEAFARSAAELLAEVVAVEIGDLIVVAPPQTLAVLRRHYDRTVKPRLIAEIDKDLTKHPVEEITRLVVRYLQETGGIGSRS